MNNPGPKTLIEMFIRLLPTKMEMVPQLILDYVTYREKKWEMRGIFFFFGEKKMRVSKYQEQSPCTSSMHSPR